MGSAALYRYDQKDWTGQKDQSIDSLLSPLQRLSGLPHSQHSAQSRITREIARAT